MDVVTTLVSYGRLMSVSAVVKTAKQTYWV